MRKTVMVILILVAVAAISAGMVYGGRGERGGQGGHRLAGLTEEQRDAVHARVTEMREAGASREEVHASVREMLDGWGIQPPERPQGDGRGEGRRGEGWRGEGRGPGHRLMEQLTQEQRDAVHARVTEMREAGASREEVHAAVHQLLESFGIELPDELGGDGAQSQSLISPAEGESVTWGKLKGDYR